MPLCSSWITDPADLCAPCSGDDGQDIIDRFGLVASLVLYGLTGRQYGGVCTDTISPNLDVCWCGQWVEDGNGNPRPLLGWPDGWDGSSIFLPHRPVRSVVEVSVGGETVDPSTYRLVDRRRLVRCAGSWPSQDACGDFTVTYEYGVGAPAGSAQMAGLYACEMWRACNNDGDCRLPKRAQTIVQEGITTAVLLGDPIALLENGLTGLQEVDGWVKALNPNGIDRAGKVLAPGRLRSHRVR